MTNLMVAPDNEKIGRQDLRELPTPEPTRTHYPVPHAEVVETLVETLAFRHLTVVEDEYAVSRDGMKLFGMLDLEVEEDGVRFSIGIRNSHDKSMSLALTVGYRVMVCENMAFWGDFTPVSRKHTKNLDVEEVISVGVDRMQRNFEPLKRDIQAWKGFELPDVRAKEVIYDAFVLRRLDAPRRLAPDVHEAYFEPEHEEFEPRTFWSLSNAFSTALKQLKPMRQYTATTDLSRFLRGYNGQGS